MNFADELFIGNNITDENEIISELKNGKTPFGIYCICLCPEGKFKYEIMSSYELQNAIKRKKYIICGIGSSKEEAFEVFRTMVEELNEFI